MRRKLPRFNSSNVTVYNAQCVHCGWKGISRTLIITGKPPIQCSWCHTRGSVRQRQES